MKHHYLTILLGILLILGNMMGAAFFLSGENSASDDSEILYKNGISAYKAKDYKTFLECFAKLNEQVPNHPTILYNLAAAYSLTNQPVKAVLSLNRLILIDANPKLSKDKDFENLREMPGFKKIVSRISEMNKPISTSKVAFVVKERDLHPESIAWDAKKNIFYLSSVHKRKIVALNQRGEPVDFISENQCGIDAVLGIQIDAENRILWATSTAAPYMMGYNEKKDKGRTGLFKFNLDNRKLLKKYILLEEGDHSFDDVVLHSKSGVYISDNKAIYRINSRDQLELIVEDSRFRSIQGLAFCDDGKKLVAADYTHGLFLCNVKTGKVILLIKHQPGFSLRGIDGLYYHKKTNSLIAVHNGLNPQRVIQYYLNLDYQEIIDFRIIEWANPVFNDATLGVVVKDTFYYIANSQWKGYDKSFKILPYKELEDIVILKAPILALRSIR